MTFIEQCIATNMNPSEIDNYIDIWHTSRTQDTIYEFLGMSCNEYAMWVQNKMSVKEIIQSRKEEK